MRPALVLFLLALRAMGMGLPTAEVAVVGSFAKGPVDVALEVDATEFDSLFGSTAPQAYPAEIQARQFFRNGGTSIAVVRIDPGKPVAEALAGSISPPHLRGLGALLPMSNLGLLVCPELTTLTDPEIAACLQQIEVLGEGRPLFTLLDPPPPVTTSAEMINWRQAHLPANLSHAAIYFPNLSLDPAKWSGGTSAVRIVAGASGTMAAVIGKNDATRGIWKSPAGNTAAMVAEDLTTSLSTSQLDALNLAGIDSLRSFPATGIVAWGSRTLDSSPENIYIATNRTRRWIVRSLQRNLSDAALQANNSTLWSSLRTRTENFLHPLFLQGALAGTTANQAYFVNCDASTTTAADIAAHRVNVLIGCALLRPAEFFIDSITLSTLDMSKPVPEVPVLFSQSISGVIHLSYPTTPGFSHCLQSSGDLAAGSWFDGGEVPGDGSWKRFEIPAADPQRFFRVKTKKGW